MYQVVTCDLEDNCSELGDWNIGEVDTELEIIKNPGRYKLHYYAVDNAGNESDVIVVELGHIDVQAPSIENSFDAEYDFVTHPWISSLDIGSAVNIFSLFFSSSIGTLSQIISQYSFAALVYSYTFPPDSSAVPHASPE